MENIQLASLADDFKIYDNYQLKDLLLVSLLEDYINDKEIFKNLSDILISNNIISDRKLLSDNTKITRMNIMQKLSRFKKHNTINNNFTRLNDIGSGAFGTVSRVVNKCDNNEYAIKKIYIKKDKKYDKTLKEVILMSKLNHPNIVRYHNSWMDMDIPMGDNMNNAIMNPVPTLNIQMELCNMTLKTYLKNRDNVNNAHVKKIIEGIINGVRYIHSQNIIHRDLNPNNILLDKELNVKIADFGISIKEGELVDDNPSYAYGDPLYTAPEVRNNNLITKRCDIYSVGVIYYELLNVFNTNMERVISMNKIQTDHPLIQNMVCPYNKRIKDLNLCYKYI